MLIFHYFQEVSSLEEAKNLLISQKLEIQNQIDGMEEKVRKVNNSTLSDTKKIAKITLKFERFIMQ